MAEHQRREKIVGEGRRLDKGIRPQPSKFIAANQNSGKDEAKRLSDLEKARKNLGTLVESYAKLLVDTTLPENRSVKDRDLQRDTLDALPKAAAELDTKNIHEGTQSLLITVLSSTFVLRDQINKLKLQNYFLNQKVQKLKEEIGTGAANSAAEPIVPKDLSELNGTGA